MANTTRKSGWPRILAFLLLLFVGLAAGLAFYVSRALQPLPASQEVRQIAYPPGTRTDELAAELERQGLIRSGQMFSLYLRYKNEGGRFQAGTYEMKPGISPDEIVGMLNRGETVKPAGIRLTVPEGFTVKQIAEKLQEAGVDGAGFLEAVRTYKLPAEGAGSLTELPPAELVQRQPLEGYLFPETYEWEQDAQPAQMVDTMVRELGKRLSELPEDWAAVVQQRGMTLHDIMTIASLIEREVVVEEERAIVSGVIHNRLQQGMPLQIDATVQYLLDKQKDRLLNKDLEVVSPYNTYKNKGLPPGPIASPSLASIRAAIYPEETRYLFYVTKKDGSRGHLFSETYEGHKRNIEESNK